MTGVRDIFTPEVIEHLKSNKNEITSDLLENLREQGDEGKLIALEILDTERDHEGYYVDSFGNRLSFNGNRGIKGQFAKMDLSDIHVAEIKRCSEDIHYFKDNYIRIRTKNGINFPEMREYQNEFITIIEDDENEDILGLLPRQSGKSVTVGIYLAHLYNFSQDRNIGIVANRGAMAREFLNNVKNMVLELPMWMQLGTIIWNKGSIENEAGMRILTDVPSSDSFRGYSINCLVIDETAFIRNTVWDEFTDSIFPSQSGLAWKKNIMISTANGMNHFYHLVEGAKSESNGMLFYQVSWKDVPRYKADGSVYSSDEFMSSIIRKYGDVYWAQNYENSFIGSSYTLLSADALKKIKPKDPEMIQNQLRIYGFPEKNHKYILAVDPAKDGIDAFATQIVDITKFPFKQVASANMQIDYLLMPEFLNEWGKMYNSALIIVENNEGAGQSVVDQLKLDYEYENLWYDKESQKSNKNKKYPGFRTTTKTRSQILKTLKLFIENDNLEVNDRETINEFFSFIHLNNKYQADDGAKDDLIMCLGIVFAPFTNTKNFEDMNSLIKGMYSNESVEFTDYLTIGNFDDFTDESYENYEGHEGESFDGYITEY